MWEFREVVFQPKSALVLQWPGVKWHSWGHSSDETGLWSQWFSSFWVTIAQGWTWNPCHLYIIHIFYHLSMLTFSLWTFIYSVFFCLEVTLWHVSAWMLIRGQAEEKKHQKDKVETERSTLQRSKTFVSLLFKSGRRRERSSSKDRKDKGTGDGHRGRSKSPKHLDNEPGESTCGLTYFDEDHFLWIPGNSWGRYLHLKSQKAA